jgi:hypothetical protein
VKINIVGMPVFFQANPMPLRFWEVNPAKAGESESAIVDIGPLDYGVER